MHQKIRIGELLIGEGLISEDQLHAALVESRKRKIKLGRALVELGFVTEERLLSALARQLRIPFVDLRQLPFDFETARRLPETHARRFRAIILEDDGRKVLVGMADPTDISALDEIPRVLKRPIRRAVVSETDLLRILDLVYRRTDEITTLAEELRNDLAETDFADAAGLSPAEEIPTAPVAKLLTSLFEDAVQVRASDIHIEPGESELHIRQRVDGILQEQVMRETRIAPALVQRLKLMSGLDISEKRLPQDGRFQIHVSDRTLDVRISTLPTSHGESVVMRLLDQSAEMLSLDQLGIPGPLLGRLRTLIRRPHGMILVTGPTGSGKTTTLYAALSLLNAPERKVITIEDPVEYRLPRVNQVQVNHKIDLGFARVLRTALRHDPDVIMVGEIRDAETARISLRAAMTGHLVFSTLHTNDSIAAAIRLIDMESEGYLVASSLCAVLAQRLVRRVCESCSEQYTLTVDERKALAGVVTSPDAADFQPRRGRGCPYCNRSGYRGRTGVYELLHLDEAMADALRRNDPAGFARFARVASGFRPLALAALDCARQGVTTLEEVFRIAGELDDPPLADDPPPAGVGGSDS
jgi:MSHA biogenesis protein MshE